MGRIIAIDYGKKRVGIAVTDPCKIIANSLTTVKSHEVLQFLQDYCSKEKVDLFVVGHPKQMNNHIFAISPEGGYMWASEAG